MATSRHTIRESVLDTITRLFEVKGKVPVTRQDVMQETGIKGDALKEHLDSLIDDGLLYRVDRGLYAPIDHKPTRPISITDMPDGSVKIEVGDDMLTLSANEHKIIAARMGARPVAELVNPGMAEALSRSIERHVRSLSIAARSEREPTGELPL
jgi:hypothetical protein